MKRLLLLFACALAAPLASAQTNPIPRFAVTALADSNQTLVAMRDYSVAWTADRTLTLPASPAEGDVIYLTGTTSTAVTLTFNTAVRRQGSTSTTTTLALAAGNVGFTIKRENSIWWLIGVPPLLSEAAGAVTDAQVPDNITITGALHSTVAGEIAAVTNKATPVSGDHLLIEDSASSNAKKEATVGSLATALSGAMSLQNIQGAVTDAQVPNNITVDLATTATTANAGDSATSFFPAGQIERARGGTAADTSAFGASLLGSDGSNNTIAVNTEAKLETAIGGTDLFSTTTKADVLQTALYAADAGSTDAYAITLSPAATAYSAGISHFIFKANTANTGAATLNVNGLGAKTIKKVATGVTTDLYDNDIRAGQFVEVVYDGTNFQMVSPTGNGPDASNNVTFNDVTASGTFAPTNYQISGNNWSFTSTGAGTLALGGGGTIAYVGTANAWGDGIKQTFNPNGTNAGINFGAQAGDPSSLANGDVWYDSTGNLLRVRVNGATDSVGLLAATQAFTNKTYNGVTLTGSSSPTLAITGTTTASGTNTGDQSIFASFIVAGQTTVTTASTSQAITLVASTGMTITTDNSTKTITLASSGGGGGGGDFSSNTSSSVDGEIVLFSGTAGKTGKRATGTGIAKITSGALGTVTADDLSGVVYAADAGSTDTYAATLSPVPSAYTTGTLYRFKANTANTGAATINFNSLGAKTITKLAGGITTALDDNDIRVGQMVVLIYDGTNMQMISALGNATAASTFFPPANWDGQGAAITGVVVLKPCESTGTITTGVLVGDQSGSVTVTVKKYTPSGGALGSSTTLGTITLSSAQQSRVTNLSWSVTAGDILEFTPSSITSVQRLNATLK